MAKSLIFLGVLACAVVLGGIAQGQNVPLPVPAPKPKIGAASDAPATTQSMPGDNNPLAAIGKLFGVNKDENSSKLDPRQREIADKVSAYLSGIRTLVGNFVQVASDGSKTQGQIYLAKPGRVRFEYDDPSPIELIADGSSVVVRDRKLATQDLYPLSQTPLRFLLADRVDLVRDTNVVGVYTDDVFTTVVIEEDAIGGKHRLMLMFDAKTMVLKQWTITDPQGFDTTVAVYNLDTTKKPDPGLFKINYERMQQ
ncbi:MAG TPA: outer membrane lipoprotein carrier protein LolA [Pseudorhodoplanes sp.]|jgi:outer membrane lipoprotein-sorting protein|nr:outer membrane lipoprotein carrier protein LolA [Pseudorhodoplanes sp.]